MMGGGFLNSRLSTRIRQKDGHQLRRGSGFQASPFDSSASFTTFAIYAPENVGKLERAMREELARAAREGFTADEVAQAKTGWLQSRQLSRAQDASLASVLGSRAFAGRTLAWDAGLEAKVSALTPAQVTDAFRRAVDPAKLVIVRAGDWSKKPAGAVP
jgi:zinc protease